jgi:RNA polymerase sigma-70 factor (ECF subfamily)
MAGRRVPEALFDAARMGDGAAIAVVLDIAQPDIRRYARSVCRSPADAEDAAQEALWLLFRRVGTIRSLAAFSGWLFTVVRRECQRLARIANLRPAQSLAGVDLERSLGERPQTEVRLDLAAAVEALPAHYREVVLLRDVREMTIDEIAAALGDTRQSVKARLHRARLLVREYLVR